MNRTEHLLVQLMEECNEVAHRCSKALRFGLREVWVRQGKKYDCIEDRSREHKLAYDNAELIRQEMADLIGVYTLLLRSRAVKRIDDERVGEKMRKVEKYLLYAQQCGTLKNEPTKPRTKTKRHSTNRN